MKKNQNTTGIILMAVSLLLLAASQWFWLRSEYNEQKRAFYSNSDLLFKETVRTIEDSLVSRMVAQSFRNRQLDTNKSKNSEKPKAQPKTVQRKTLIIRDTVRLRRIDSVALGSADSVNKLNLDLILKTETLQDSLARIKRIVAQMPKVAEERSEESNNRNHSYPRRRFYFQSASVDSLDQRFKERIHSLDYAVDFKIKKDTLVLDSITARSIRGFSDWHKKLRTQEDSIFVNGVKVLNPEIISSFSIVPSVIFKATPVNLHKYLMKRLQNNIIFSVVLLLITALTFTLIYRNLQKQARLNTLKNDLISNITHELKTPLSTISVAIEALQQFGDRVDPKTTQEYLEISQNEVSRLNLMVENILNASLLEKQAVAVEQKEVDLAQLISRLVNSWKPKFNLLDGEVTLTIEGVNAIVFGDEVQLTGVINNLIDNAVKYSEIKPQVNVLLHSNNEKIEISISDKGPGIPKEYQKQVFDKFFRVPTGDRHNVKGYGLGLNFVKHIMDLHKGSVSLKSSDAGTTFTLNFLKKA